MTLFPSFGFIVLCFASKVFLVIAAHCMLQLCHFNKFGKGKGFFPVLSYSDDYCTRQKQFFSVDAHVFLKYPKPLKRLLAVLCVLIVFSLFTSQF